MRPLIILFRMNTLNTLPLFFWHFICCSEIKTMYIYVGSCLESCEKKASEGETLTDSIERMNTYRAIASPTYLLLTSADPILSAFDMSRETNKLSMELPENQVIFI